MSFPECPHLLDRLEPEVVGFKRLTFALKYDLERLTWVRQVEAHEAAALYCGRIVESLAAAALDDLGKAEANAVFNNLITLEQYHLLLLPTRFWAHSLRRLGNAARHITRSLSSQDTEVALLFLERWLHWFFCQCASRPSRLTSLTQDGQPLRWAVSPKLLSLIEPLNAADIHTQTLVEFAQANCQNKTLLQTPSLAGMVAEMLLDRQETAAAFTLLDAALQEVPDDLRLGQLLGLYHSRTDNLQKALACLLPREDRDEESTGILAGVYKRFWLKDRTNREYLEKCYVAYRTGWRKSGKKNVYLGINVATTALFSGNRPYSAEVAGIVQGLLQERSAAAATWGMAVTAVPYWDQVTLAEAQLLLDDPAAFQTYRNAFAQYPKLFAAIDAARRQAKYILEAAGRTHEVARLP